MALELLIRQGVPEDAPAATALAWRAKSSWGYPAEWLELWREALSITPEYLAARQAVVASIGDELVGVCVVEAHGKDASLEHAWVAPNHQQRGIGRALVARALAIAVREGLERVEVESDPYAEPFYLHLGARRIGARPAPMPGAPERVLPLLEFRLNESSDRAHP